MFNFLELGGTKSPFPDVTSFSLIVSWIHGPGKEYIALIPGNHYIVPRNSRNVDSSTGCWPRSALPGARCLNFRRCNRREGTSLNMTGKLGGAPLEALVDRVSR